MRRCAHLWDGATLTSPRPTAVHQGDVVWSPVGAHGGDLAVIVECHDIDDVHAPSTGGDSEVERRLAPGDVEGQQIDVKPTTVLHAVAEGADFIDAALGIAAHRVFNDCVPGVQRSQVISRSIACQLDVSLDGSSDLLGRALTGRSRTADEPLRARDVDDVGRPVSGVGRLT